MDLEQQEDWRRLLVEEVSQAINWERTVCLSIDRGGFEDQLYWHGVPGVFGLEITDPHCLPYVTHHLKLPVNDVYVMIEHTILK